MASASTDASAQARPTRAVAAVTSLDALVGGHPDALRDIYLSGAPCNPVGLDRLRGRLLALAPLAGAHLLVRPAITALAESVRPWEGKTFESGGTTGANLILGRQTLRFRCEVAPSFLDGMPALRLEHDGLGNAWPAEHLVDELREVGPGVFIGPLGWRDARGNTSVVLWWGLSTR